MKKIKAIAACGLVQPERLPKKVDLSSEETEKLMQEYFFQLGNDIKESEKELLLAKLHIFYLLGKKNNPGHENALKDYLDESNSKVKSELFNMYKKILEAGEALDKNK